MAETRLQLARSELILGGQKSGKSRRAEMLARDWLAQSADHPSRPSWRGTRGYGVGLPVEPP